MKMKVGVYAQKHVDGTINYELNLSSLIRHALGATHVRTCMCVFACVLCALHIHLPLGVSAQNGGKPKHTKQEPAVTAMQQQPGHMTIT